MKFIEIFDEIRSISKYFEGIWWNLSSEVPFVLLLFLEGVLG